MASTKEKQNENNLVKLVDSQSSASRSSKIGRTLAAILSLSIVLSFLVIGQPKWNHNLTRIFKTLPSSILLDDIELKAYDGTDLTKPIYVALNGTIYDVSEGVKFYGPGGQYHMLAGKDATRAFITGCFGDDESPDIRGAEWTYVPKDVPGLDEHATGAQKIYRQQELRKARKQVESVIEGWRQVFSGATGKPYFKVGQVSRPDGWLKDVPLKELCQKAQEKRPESSQDSAAGDGRRP